MTFGGKENAVVENWGEEVEKERKRKRGQRAKKERERERESVSGLDEHDQWSGGVRLEVMVRSQGDARYGDSLLDICKVRYETPELIIIATSLLYHHSSSSLSFS